MEENHETKIPDYNCLLEGKRAFITIAAQGIGRATALLFARQGAVVAFGARKQYKLDRTLTQLNGITPGCKGYLVDFSDPRQTEKTCDEVLLDFGGIDILVNVVGVDVPGPIQNYRDEDLEYLLETNFKSSLRCIRKLVPGMLERKVGSIINISSIHSVMTMPNNAMYAATKGAMNASVRAMALDWSGCGVRVNTICPGLIMSDAIKEEIASHKEGRERDDFLKLLRNMQPLPIGTVEDVANACLYLASDMSRYMTGQIIMLDGGASIKAHP